MESANLPKTRYSEKVVRKALYWFSEIEKWKLEEDADHWIVWIDSTSTNSAVSLLPELHRILNDFVLREQLDDKTGELRQRVITSALERLSRDD